MKPCSRKRLEIRPLLVCFIHLLVCSTNAPVLAQQIAPHAALVIGRVGNSGRSPVHTDAIEAKIVSGTWRPPVEGERVEVGDGVSEAWRVLSADTNGWFSDRALRGGYVF